MTLPSFTALAETLTPVFGGALRASARSIVVAVGWGVCCIGLSAALVIDTSAQGAVFVAVSGVLLVIVSGFLALKSGILAGIGAAVTQGRLAGRLVGLIFARLGVGEDSIHGERGGVITKTAERVPLRVAEQRVSAAVSELLQERAQQTGVRAWFARRLLSSVLARVQGLTLVRFRDYQARYDGVDLALLREELAGSVDRLIAEQAARQARRIQALVLAGYGAVVAGIALIIHQLMA